MEPSTSNEIWSIIPARGGSKGIPKKNIYPLGGKPLIAHTIEYIKQCRAVSRIIVSTDDPDIAEAAERFGAWVPEFRPKEISHDSSSMSDAYWHGVDTAVKKTDITPAKILVLYPTSPFRPAYLIEEAIRELDESLIYKVCQKIGHERGYYQKDHDGSLRLIHRGGGVKQTGLLFGTRYFPPGFRPFQNTFKAFCSYVAKLEYCGGGTSIRIIEPTNDPWCIDIDTFKDLELAEWYFQTFIKKEHDIGK